MSDTKKYYYMRLKENFFDSDAIVILESQQDGILYSNILLKMYLKSLKNNGLLMVNELIPYNSQMIASITKQPIGVVEKALVVFKNLGLIDVLEGGAIYMSDIELFVGQSSSEAERKKQKRLEIKASGQLADKCPTNIHHSIEIRDKSIDIEKENKKEKAQTRFVPPTLEQVQAYCQERNNGIDAEYFIDYYTARNWELKKGQKVKDWKACVRTWEKRNFDNNKKKPSIEINPKQREGMVDVVEWSL